MRLCLLAAVLAALPACAGSEDARAVGPSAQPSADRVEALADSLGAAASTTPRRAFLQRALRRAGVTPLRDGRGAPSYQLDLGVPIVGGFIPGRHPVGRADLVVVGTRLDGPGVAAVLEATRVIVERSLWVSQPERALHVAFWPAGDGARQAVRSSVWPRDAIRAVVVVGGEGPDLVDGIPVIRLPADGDPLALAETIVTHVLTAATHVSPALPVDSLAALRGSS